VFSDPIQEFQNRSSDFIIQSKQPSSYNRYLHFISNMAFQNLGDLIELPGEIRAIIWQSMRPQNDIHFKSNMSILRICKELSPYIYDKEILTFKFSPQSQHRSRIFVTSELGANRPLESSELSTYDQTWHRCASLPKFERNRDRDTGSRSDRS